MFERGDLVLIPFPFSDLSAAKKRPVLLLTRPDVYGDFIALAVTRGPKLITGSRSIRPISFKAVFRSLAGFAPIGW